MTRVIKILFVAGTLAIIAGCTEAQWRKVEKAAETVAQTVVPAANTVASAIGRESVDVGGADVPVGTITAIVGALAALIAAFAKARAAQAAVRERVKAEESLGAIVRSGGTEITPAEVAGLVTISLTDLDAYVKKAKASEI